MISTAELKKEAVRLHRAAIVDTSDDAIIFENLEGVILAWNSAAERMFGYAADEAVGQSIAIVVSPEFQRAEIEILERLRAGQRVDHYQMRRVSRNGATIDLSISVRPVKNAEGETIGASIIARDIKRRRAEANRHESAEGSQLVANTTEAALSTMSQRLIEAQEKERTSIARELHDDIGQRLALLVMNMRRLCNRTSLAEIRDGIHKAIQHALDLGKEMRALSHRLHSATLDYVGLDAAASAYCSELTAHHKVQISFHSENIPPDLSREVSLCLYRILQEALQNAMKHSGSQHVRVLLNGGTDEIELAVHDVGNGFEPEQAFKKCGIGLSSMSERVKLVNGKFSVNSELGRGTTVSARVPLSPKARRTNGAECA